MVHEQGEMVDSIEVHVSEAQVRVGEGTQQLRQAEEYKVLCGNTTIKRPSWCMQKMICLPKSDFYLVLNFYYIAYCFNRSSGLLDNSIFRITRTKPNIAFFHLWQKFRSFPQLFRHIPPAEWKVMQFCCQPRRNCNIANIAHSHPTFL